MVVVECGGVSSGRESKPMPLWDRRASQIWNSAGVVARENTVLIIATGAM